MSQDFDNALVSDIMGQLNATQKLGEQAFATISTIVKDQQNKIKKITEDSGRVLQNAEGKATQAALNAANARAAANASKAEADKAKTEIAGAQAELAQSRKEAAASTRTAGEELAKLKDEIESGKANSRIATEAMTTLQNELSELKKTLEEMKEASEKKDEAHKKALRKLEIQKDEEKNADVAKAVEEAQTGMKKICTGSVTKALIDLQQSTADIAKLAGNAQRGGFRSSSAPVKRGSLKKYRSSSRSYTSKGYKKNKNTKKIYFKPKKGKKSRK